jgi:NAD(P)-dependent dehydrogenase (short-subunit alcohol dehydrogenase family)
MYNQTWTLEGDAMTLDVGSLHGKVCLVTGATSGIGRVTALELARRGARVVLAGRSRARCEATVADIRARTGNGEVEALLADLSVQEQVQTLARSFRDRHTRLDVLVNNAGGIWLTRQLTVDGLEMTFAVNHLAYFLLTQLLLDTLRASAPARVVNVSSEAHRKASLDFDDLMGEQHYHGWTQYCRSKLMNLLFTYDLARRLEGTGVTANALHPGWVATRFAGNNGWKGWLWQLVARCFAISPEKGARTVLHAAAAPDLVSVSGRYFVHERAVPSSAESHDEAAARRLWQLSLDAAHLHAAGPV